MFNEIGSIFSNPGFMPHIHCYLDRHSLVWTMFSTDLLIGIAYLGISFTLWALVRKIKIAFSFVILCFGVFIGACGMTHFMEVWTLWRPDYWATALVKIVTAVASVGTAIYLFRLRHSIVLVAVAAKLSEERRIGLEALTETLEDRVRERTTEIQNTNQKLNLIADGVPALISFIDVNLRYQFINASYEKWFGRPRDEIVGKTMLEVLGENAIKALSPNIQIVLRGEKAHFETQIDYKSAGIRWIDGTYIPQFGPNNEVNGFVVLINDITEIKKAEIALRESEHQFRSLAESIPQLAWMSNPDGYIFWYNKRWYDYTGTTPQQMEGWGWQNVHDATILPKVMSNWKKSLETGETFDMEFPIRSATGKFRWFLTRVEPVRNSSGKIVRWFGTNTDIEDDRQFRIFLQEAIHARDEFLSIASHELKTPLTSLKLQTQLRLRALAKDSSNTFQFDRLRSMFQGDLKQLDRLSRLIDDMLDISRISTGNLKMHPESFDLCDLVKEVIERNRPQFIQSQCEIEIKSCESIIGSWDRDRIDQVISNLLINALKYGAGKPVWISLQRSEKTARLTVQDQGIGISKENLERIFHRYERAISANEVSGLGLGLYIAKKIVEMHEGKIWVESELGHGSTFVVELPIRSTPLHE